MMRTRTFALAFAIAALVALAIPGVAMANFAIHGNYVSDTDACAGCHRAHTSISSVTWNDGVDDRSALLVSSATTMYEFCYACHDATGQGADTNVQEGIYEGSLYGTNGATLNGGGTEYMPSFDATLGINVNTPVTSEHEFRGSSWGAFGGGYSGGTPYPDGQILGANTGESVDIKMDCATCHDPHGSPNYRILKTQVNGNQVGQYVGSGTDPDPDGYVSSVETGWPAGGFRLHRAYDDYKPDYTTPRYAKGYDMTTGAENSSKGMSGWCAGCHQVYLRDAQTFTKSSGATYTASASVYNAGDGGGLRLRHRHPINVPLSNYGGPDKASMNATSAVPLAHSLNESSTPTRLATDGDWIECLTCHRAHGTIANMKGYAADGSLPIDTDGVGRNNFPGDPSALLRLDNRGVCETCHNK
jgi:hypothetical protein